MAIRDLLTAVRVGDPHISPDGRVVAYVRTTTDLANGGRRNADIWGVPAAGGAPRLLIGGDKSESTPRWLGDGRLAFISSRDGAPQVYVANADGAGVTRVTSLSGGVQPPLVISPDGRMAAFVSDVYPECADESCNKARREAADASPVKMRTLTRLLYRHWDEWREDIRHHVFVAPIAGGQTRDVTPGDFDSPPGQQEDAGIAFSADSQSVAFVSNREGNDREAWTTNNDVFVVSILVSSGGGAATKVTTSAGADAQPVFTRDGKSMIVRSQRRAGFESDRWRLDVYDRASNARRTVFETPDLSVSDYLLSPDERDVLFTATEGGTDNLYRVPLTGGTVTRLAKGGAIGAPSVAADTIVFSKSTLTAPADIFRLSVTGGSAQPVALTHENDSWLKDVAFAAPESQTVKGVGHADVQYWLIKPPAFDASKKYPVVFLIHGGPQGDWGDGWSSRWNPSLWAAQGWVVVAPNPRGSTGFGQPFVDDISHDWGGKAMDDLTAVFDAVVKLPYIDATKQGVAGASYGGYAVNWLIGHTTRFKAAITHDGVFNLESMGLATEELWFSEWEAGGTGTSEAAHANALKWSPHTSVDRVRTPTLIITNELDFRVPVDQGLQLFTALKRNGVPARALVFPDEGHWVLKALNSQRWHEEVFGWMKRYLQ